MRLAILAAAAAAVWGAEGQFERTLKVTGPVEMEVKTGAGSIQVLAGEGSSVKVVGRIRVGDRRISEGEAQERVRRLEANPPIEQNGNVIRIGQLEDRMFGNNVSISYDVTVPAQTRLRAHTGSGSQTIDGVAGPVEAATGSGGMSIRNIKGAVRAATGSGNIRAAGVGGGFTGTTGSGSVHAALTGPGDVEITTGSGSVDVSGVKGAVRVSTGSGTVAAEGQPAGPWKLETASGSIRVRVPVQAAFDLNARTSSGRIATDHPLAVQGAVSPKKIDGKVRGGGPLLALSTASGNITIE